MRGIAPKQHAGTAALPSAPASTRRDWLGRMLGLSAAAGLASSPVGLWAAGRTAAGPADARCLVLVELAGGNDGLNTVVPHADAAYRALRPRLALRDEQLIRLDARTALHAALAPLMPIVDAGELAIVQGLGYPQPNLSHFRSIEIWDTASSSDVVLQRGWIARALDEAPASALRTADGVLVGAVKAGALQGAASTVHLNDAAAFVQRARLAQGAAAAMAERVAGNAALAALLRAEQAVLQAALGLGDEGAGEPRIAQAGFPAGNFGAAAQTAARIIDLQRRRGRELPVVVLRLGGFDTHVNQLGLHAALLGQLAEGLAALRRALIATGHWQQTLVMTYSEFGRRAAENQSAGTDHGSAAPHFVMGGGVRGGLYGEPPALDRLDEAGNPRHTVDFRRLYATVLESFWGRPSQGLFGARFEPLPLFAA